jgi:Tol biopolymer transport system component/serine/threonine protein kinase
MAPERDRQISALFHAACELTSEQRVAFLAQACADDDELRREVEQLLAGDEQAGEFLNQPVHGVAARLLAGPAAGAALLPAGRRIGHYRIVSRLGAGGMGEVYLAEDTQLDRQVALKLLPAEFTADAERVRRFIREAKAASALNHPNIVTVHEIGQSEGLHFIVAEYVDGQTLRERMRSETLSLSDALDVAVQVAGALSVAHEAGVVHRDIKPENLMLRRDGYVKVLDFGLAKLTERGRDGETEGRGDEETGRERDAFSPRLPVSPSLPLSVSTTPGAVMGTAHYMSPEQARGQRVDARADIFSLGVVLYEMVAGRAPFDGVNAIEVLGAILNREPAPLPPRLKAPRELERIIAKTMRKNRDERYQTSKALLIDLKDLRHELEFQAEVERKSHSGARAAATSGQTLAETGWIESADTFKTAPRSTGELLPLDAGIKHRKAGLALMLAAIVAVASLGFGLYQFIARGRSSTRSVPKIIPFTSFPGAEFRPSFSPDGNQLAFEWNGEKEDNYDIYAKLVDNSALLRLTTHPARDYSPAWSPDGRSIAFLRSLRPENVLPAMDVYLVSALGGADRKLAEGIRTTESPSLSWSPDGKFLALGDKTSPDGPDGIFLLEIGSGQRRKLTSPPAQIEGDSTPAFSPDGRKLAFVRWVTSGVSDLYLTPAAGGEPKRITFDNATIRGLAWTPDGEEIVFASERRGVSSLWRISARGGEPELAEAIGSSVQYPIVSSRGDRLAFTQLINDTNIYRVDLTAPASQRSSRDKFLASTLEDDSPQYSPDGKSIVFGSTRSGSFEIWLCGSEGQQPRQLTTMGGPLTGTPRWSPDSRQIAFDSRSQGNADIYVISVEGGAPRRLTTEPSEDVVPGWSKDGRWVYFCSNRGGRREIYKLPSEGGPAVQVTTQGGFECFESPDGQFLYYTKRSYDSTLWRRPTAGGEETLAFNSDRVIHMRNWALSNQGVYFASSESAIEFLNFATGKATPVATAEKRLTRGVPGLTVSADGKWMLFTQIEQQGSDIMLMENFR